MPKGWNRKEANRGQKCFGRTEMSCFQLLNDVEFDLRNTLSDNSQRLGGRIGKIDNASGNEGTAVVDANRHGLPSGDVGDAHTGAERERTMSGS